MNPFMYLSELLFIENVFKVKEDRSFIQALTTGQLAFTESSQGLPLQAAGEGTQGLIPQSD